MVSVVLPFYNAEATLKRAITSILDQTLKDFELLLVNNNSTDLSVEIAKEALIDERVKLIGESVQGVVHAANRGLREARGTYIARMDADDWSFPDRLNVQAEFLDSNGEIGLVSGQVEHDGANPKEGFKKYLEWSNSVLGPNEIYLKQFVEYPIVNPSIMIRREVIDDFGYYHEGNFPEDYEFFLRLQQGGVQMQKVKTSVLKWNDLADRLTRTHPSYTELAFDKIKTKYLGQWLETCNLYHPRIWIWGAGKKARSKQKLLQEHGVEALGYIEVSNKEHSRELPIVHFEDLPDVPDRFIVSFIGSWGARNQIRNFLIKKGWQEGLDFILAA